MAIKGKGKTKNRPTTRAPRRGPVEVPTPFTQRRWVQLLAALVIGAGIVWFLIWLTNGIRQSGVDERETAAAAERRAIAQEWKALVEAELLTVGAPAAAGAPPVVAAELGPTLEALAEDGGDVTPIEGLDERLEAVADRLEGFPLAREIRGRFDLAEANALLNSQEMFVRALRTYAASARLGIAATDLGGATRTAVLDEAQALARVAGASLDDGWNDYGIGLQGGGLTPGDPTAGLGGGLAPSLGG